MRVCQTRHILNLCRSKHHVVARHRLDRLRSSSARPDLRPLTRHHFTTARRSQAIAVPISRVSYEVIGRLLSMGILRRFNLR